MSVNPLSAMGRWRGGEGAIEILLPLLVMGGAWFFVYGVLSAPMGVRPFTVMELWACLGACVGLTAWAISRQLYMGGKRSPWSLVSTSVIVSLGLAWLVAGRVEKAFTDNCSEAFEGEIIQLAAIDQGDTFANLANTSGVACKVGGVVDNVYLVGTLMRPAWDGQLTVPLLLFLVAVAVFATLGLRTVRMRPTSIAFKLMKLLRFAPAKGSKAAMGEPAPSKGEVVACNNPTLWGETCGQIYSKEKEWYAGEWCVRCQQAFVPAPRTFTFRIVTLFTGDVDILNGIERIDTVSWPRGEPIAPDGRLSGQERWVVLGTMEFPDIITVAQALALVHEQLETWKGSDDARVHVAARAAVARSSKVSCWFWRGQLSHRLTYARPTNDVLLAMGPQRLRDLIEDGGDELWLQLDIGLLPLELRTGFKKTFVEDGRAPELQNSKFDLWVPVSNQKLSSEDLGLWVPRVEGHALRSWLSLDRLRSDKIKGVTVPLPYLRYDPSNRGRPPEGHDLLPTPGSLDMVRYPMNNMGMEPEGERRIGASISEWDWMEWKQIELLRKECLVLE